MFSFAFTTLETFASVRRRILAVALSQRPQRPPFRRVASYRSRNLPILPRRFALSWSFRNGCGRGRCGIGRRGICWFRRRTRGGRWAEFWGSGSGGVAGWMCRWRARVVVGGQLAAGGPWGRSMPPLAPAVPALAHFFWCRTWAMPPDMASAASALRTRRLPANRALRMMKVIAEA